jgi:hypothetical protein
MFSSKVTVIAVFDGTLTAPETGLVETITGAVLSGGFPPPSSEPPPPPPHAAEINAAKRKRNESIFLDSENIFFIILPNICFSVFL